MKKLLILLFSLLISFNSYGEEICNANIGEDFTLLVGVFPEPVEIYDDKLLTICEEDDILVLSGLKNSNALTLTPQEVLANYIAWYCDLSETQIVDNQVLVCKLVERDL
jgi:hypothetical protein